MFFYSIYKRNNYYTTSFERQKDLFHWTSQTFKIQDDSLTSKNKALFKFNNRRRENINKYLHYIGNLHFKAHMRAGAEFILWFSTFTKCRILFSSWDKFITIWIQFLMRINFTANSFKNMFQGFLLTHKFSRFSEKRKVERIFFIHFDYQKWIVVWLRCFTNILVYYVEVD